ncbi:MFS transporter [Streptomyces sp. KR80]|uniref:MFS transporter n=1 Tax=Streptomyces sp. KR80 TaxID=3457426 RepID=UPI003FD30728
MSERTRAPQSLQVRSGGGFFAIYTGSLLIAGAYGLTLLLPAYVKSLGENEAMAGLIYWCGAIGAVGSLVVGGRMAQRVGPSTAAMAGSVIYAVATGIIAGTTNFAAILVAGVLLGTGWALFFTTVPIVISARIEAEKRSLYFLVLAGFNALGMGVTPIIGAKMVDQGASYRLVFVVAVLLSVVSAAAFATVVWRQRKSGLLTSDEGREGGIFGPVARVLRSPARPFLVMVLLGACVFSAMTTYQTTFANSRGIDSAYFYAAYTLGVIVPRFTVSRRISGWDPARTTMVLLAGMCASLVLFLLVGHNVILYAISSLILGITYGLVYPIIQAQAANYAPGELRHWALWYFSLAYFIGVYGFPLIAGTIIVVAGYQIFVAALLAIAMAELAVSLKVFTTGVTAPAET